MGSGCLGEVVLTSTQEYPQSMFWIKNKNNCIPLITLFNYIQVGYKGVYNSQTCYPDVRGETRKPLLQVYDQV